MAGSLWAKRRASGSSSTRTCSRLRVSTDGDGHDLAKEHLCAAVVPGLGIVGGVEAYVTSRGRQQDAQRRLETPPCREIGRRRNPGIVHRVDEQGRHLDVFQPPCRRTAIVVVVGTAETVTWRRPDLVKAIDAPRLQHFPLEVGAQLYRPLTEFPVQAREQIAVIEGVARPLNRLPGALQIDRRRDGYRSRDWQREIPLREKLQNQVSAQ